MDILLTDVHASHRTYVHRFLCHLLRNSMLGGETLECNKALKYYVDNGDTIVRMRSDYKLDGGIL